MSGSDLSLVSLLSLDLNSLDESCLLSLGLSLDLSWEFCLVSGLSSSAGPSLITFQRALTS